MVAAAAARAAMGTSAAAEDVEFVDFDQDDDDDQAGGRAARALPVPHIVSPAVVRTRGRLLGLSPSVLASSRDRFDPLSDAGNSGHGPQRCENPLRNHFFGVISKFGVLVFRVLYHFRLVCVLLSSWFRRNSRGIW